MRLQIVLQEITNLFLQEIANIFRDDKCCARDRKYCTSSQIFSERWKILCDIANVLQERTFVQETAIANIL